MGVFLPVLLLALVSCGLGLLAGRYLWPNRSDATGQAPPQHSSTGGDVVIDLTDVERSLQRSESQLAQIREEMGRRNRYLGAIRRARGIVDDDETDDEVGHSADRTSGRSAEPATEGPADDVG